MSSEKVPAQPAQIGPYRILEVIGEGGMGTVYLAEQKEPVRRRAALKVIKLGMDSKAVIARFEQERQALALMDHEGIAKVYDCGTTDRGQPYFAMELVKGIPLDQFCEQQKLALEDRIVLMQQVCSAVQHAHLKGVVHRDLKPGNVLVSDHGGKFAIKVIDFGLAKAMGQKLVEATLFTEAGQVVGTPEYMAPEQADPTNQDIDTRADVYSLGVMLYQTLCGELPFPGAELRRAGMLEVQRILREVDPPKPSTKVTKMGESGSAVAGNRRVSLGALQRVLRNDLDWVVLKAMEKQRNRRYETANALAADLQRFLDHEPLVAGPPSATYRLHKLVQRYRGQVLAGAAVLATALGGAGFAVNYAFEAEEQARVAEDRAKQIVQLAQKDRVYADLARLQDAASRAAALWPAVPSRIPELERWIAEVEPTLRRLPEVESELALLRQQRAQPVADEVRAAARASVATEIERLQKESDDAQPRERRVLELDLADAEVQLETAGHAFDDRADAERHLQLARLATKIRSFARDLPAYRRGALASVRARLAQAQALAAARPTHEQAWQEAIAAVAASNGTTASTLYEHFVLRDQEGLVPVGMDPVSKLWEFVHLASGTPGKEIPVRDEKTGRLVPTGDMGIVFVLLPGGVLPVEDGMQPDHRHSVRLDPFFLSKYEMTQGQWLRLAGRIPAAPAKGNNLALPVYQVSWFDSEELLRLQGLMLPSELQWEYGIRGGTRTRWWTGTTEESLAEKENMNTPFGSLFLPVGSLAANGFGLLDMGGNACEWCLDEDGDYGTERAGDGLRAPAGAQNRLYRGGDVAFGAESAQSSFRLLLQPPSFRTHFIGLRPARTARP